MKWLFAVLVALNIIVFGATVAGRVAEKQKNTVAPTVPVVAEAQHELAPPMIEMGKEASGSAALDWVGESESIPVAVSEPVDDELLLAEMDKKAKEEQDQAAKEKKEQQEKAKREREQKEAEMANRNRQCTSNASITLEEDDYHRIKGLLKQWPHVASRTVEKRGSKPKAAQSQKTYRVLVPSGGDAMAQLDNLAAKGFSGTFYEGDISVGVTRSRSAAQVLISRLATAGFGGTRIDEQDDQNTSENNSLSVAKMQVMFVNIDDKNAAAIQNIVERYGKLSRGACK